ncbi:MAG: hypothetical protein PXY39_11540 [archaeon]|nr:hypothetical protein [archaeon]
MIKRLVFYLTFLIALLIFGLVVVPTLVSEYGIIVQSGSSFSFYTISFLNIPFQVQHPAKLTGSFSSNIPVILYLLNSSQWASFNMFCPIANTTAVSANVTEIHLSVSIKSAGNYDLLFCDPIIYGSLVQIQVTISVQLS